jgi:iron(III) transport system substrate-binding protein
MKARFSTVVAVGLLLAACGGGSASTAPASSPASSPAAASKPAGSTAGASSASAKPAGSTAASAKPAASGAAAAKTVGSAGASGAATASDSLDAVKADAQKAGGKVVWYDSIEQDQGDQITKQFVADYPFMTGAKFVSVVSGDRLARITQESSAHGPTADVDFEDAATAAQFNSQGFLNTVDWQGLGIKSSPEMTPTNYMVAITAPYYVFYYNTNKVKEADVPKTMDELLDPKWKGRIGTWARPSGLEDFVAVWGEQQTIDYVKKLALQKPHLYDSNFTVAQNVGSGIDDIAFTTYHTSIPTTEKGAPAKAATVDPTPINVLYGYSLKYGANAAGGKLLLQWLAGAHGAQVYEQVSGRGNPYVPETKTAQMLKGMKLATFAVDQQIKDSAHMTQLQGQLTKLLKGQ